MTYKYTIPNYHEELFGDMKPRSATEIVEIMIGSGKTNAMNYWLKFDESEKKKSEKFFYDIKVSDLINYCDKLGWEYEEPEHAHHILVADIKKNGIHTPLLVCNSSQNMDKYSVLEGRHRAGAARLLGIEKVKCLVITRIP